MSFFKDSEVLSGKRSVGTVPKCGACGLYKKCKSPKMQPAGKGRKRILLLGEAPGADEDEEGEPFVGRSGQLLEESFARVGVDMRQDCWITNSLICRPPHNAIPKPAMIDYCRPNLFNTIQQLEPDVIISFGLTAVRSLIGHVWKENPGSMAAWAGFRIPNQKPNLWICPTYHPAYLLRMDNAVLNLHFSKHLKRAVNLQGKPWKEVPDYEARVQRIINVHEAADKLRELHASRPELLAFDYETNMKKPDSDQAEIVTCSVSDGETTLAYPWHGSTRQATGDLLFDKAIPKTAHNLKFEQRWTIKEFGKPVKNWRLCSMIGAHIIDNRAGVTGLKFQSFVRLGFPAYDEHIKLFLKAKTGNTVNRVRESIALRQLLLYCGLDSLLQWEIAQQQMKEMKL